MRTVRIILNIIVCLACISAIIEGGHSIFPYVIFGLSVLLIILEFSLSGESIDLYCIKHSYGDTTLSYFVYAEDKQEAQQQFKKDKWELSDIISIEKVETE